MHFIYTSVRENGSRPPIQAWDDKEAPEGFALCPDEFIPVFTEAKGFVDIEIDSGAVVSMAENTEARLAWEAANPDKPPEPTAEQDTMQMLVDQEYRLTLIELGVM